MMNVTVSSLSDRELLTETRRVAGTERQATAALVSLLAEVDARRLYLGEGYSSLFAFCTRALHLSEQAAYGRITAARAARRFPIIQSLLGDGAISLTTLGLLAPHLTDDNHEAILRAARYRSKRDVERWITWRSGAGSTTPTKRRVNWAIGGEHRLGPDRVDGARPIRTPRRTADALDAFREIEAQVGRNVGLLPAPSSDCWAIADCW